MAIVLDGTNSFATLAASSDWELEAGTGWTIGMRFNIASNAGSGQTRLFEWGNLFYVGIYEASFSFANRLFVTMLTPGFALLLAGTATQTPGSDTDQWQTLIVTRDTNGTATAYLNGSASSLTSTNKAAGDVAYTGNSIVLGGSLGTYRFNGRIQDFFATGEALSAEKIQDFEYGARPDQLTSDLIWYCPLDGTSDEVVTGASITTTSATYEPQQVQGYASPSVGFGV